MASKATTFNTVEQIITKINKVTLMEESAGYAVAVISHGALSFGREDHSVVFKIFSDIALPEKWEDA